MHKYWVSWKSSEREEVFYEKLSLIGLSLLFLLLVVVFDKKEEKVTVNASSPLTAAAKVIGANNESYGNAYFQEEDNGVMMTLALTGLPPGTHGIHIHEVGKCEPPKFESAGAHFNPTKRNMVN